MRVILFDLLNAQPNKSSKYHGGGEYIKTVFAALVERCKKDVQIVPFYDSQRFLDGWIKSLIQSKKLKTIDVKSIDQIQMVADQISADIFFSGLPEHYRREWFPQYTKIIGVIHGLRKIEKSHDKYEWKYFDGKQQIISKLRLFKSYMLNKEKKLSYVIAEQKRVIELLDMIICDSYHTYYALIYYYKDTVLDKLKVFYPPLKQMSFEANVNIPEEIKGKFLLILGGDRWLKNAYRSVMAIDSLYTRGFLGEIQTVLVGQTSQTIKTSIENESMFVWLDYVENAQLEALYKNCEVFVYPTLNEGFGYPPLEAMSFGKTCVVSAVCSLPEVCGNAVYYINPYDEGEIANRILYAVDMPIEYSVIKNHMSNIYAKQNKDLEALCDYILNIN